jgi:hypothetical protein
MYPKKQSFNEEEWLNLLFMMNDMQYRINQLARHTLYSVPMKKKKKLFCENYYLSLNALTHILERHYYKLPYHPGVSKFIVSIPDILYYLRRAAHLPALPIEGSVNLQRVFTAATIIGTDISGLPTNDMTVITDVDGRIITAFPGRLCKPEAYK